MSYFYTPPDNFMPGKALWLRKAAWFIRNPELHIIPKMDKVDIPTWNPFGGLRVIPYHFSGWPPRFISYRGKYIEAYIGWRPSGSFGMALRHANSKGY